MGGVPMRAGQIAEDFPSVVLDDEVLTAACVVARGSLPGVVVTGSGGRPCGLLPACDLVAGVVPGFVRESPGLARVYDDEGADQTVRGLMTGRLVGEVLSDTRFRVVDGDATAMEMAAAMALLHSPLVLVRLADRGWGVVTANRLLACLLPPA